MPLLHDVAHLAHAELLTPEPEQSLWFFTQVLGLTENGSSGDSVYRLAAGHLDRRGAQEGAGLGAGHDPFFPYSRHSARSMIGCRRARILETVRAVAAS